MSQYSLQELNREKYIEETEDMIIYNFDNYIMHKRFRVGNGIEDEDELEHSLLFYKLLCTENCSLLRYIQDKIEGKLQNPPKNKITVDKLVTLHKQEEICSEQESCKTISWGKVEW